MLSYPYSYCSYGLHLSDGHKLCGLSGFTCMGWPGGRHLIELQAFAQVRLSISFGCIIGSLLVIQFGFVQEDWKDLCLVKALPDSTFNFELALPGRIFLELILYSW